MYYYSSTLYGIMIGFIAMLGSICALGPQNLLAIQRGASRYRVLSTATFFIVGDGMLLAFAVTMILTGNNFLLGNSSLYRFGGVVLLAFMGIRMFEKGINGDSLVRDDHRASMRILPLVIATFANPGVYIDTIGLLSSLSTTYETHPAILGLGAWLASILWFITLVSVAYWMGKKVVDSYAWVLLNFFSGGIFIYFSWKLFLSQ